MEKSDLKTEVHHAIFSVLEVKRSKINISNDLLQKMSQAQSQIIYLFCKSVFARETPQKMKRKMSTKTVSFVQFM